MGYLLCPYPDTEVAGLAVYRFHTEPGDLGNRYCQLEIVISKMLPRLEIGFLALAASWLSNPDLEPSYLGHRRD